MMTRGRLYIGVRLAAVATVAGSWGEEERAPGGAGDSDRAKEVGRNPYSLTCGDLANRGSPRPRVS